MKIAAIALTDCPLKLQNAQLSQTDSGNVISYDLADPTDMDMTALELTVFQCTAEGVLTDRQPIPVDPGDLPVEAGQHKALTLNQRGSTLHAWFDSV